jgi:hypothetical protein
LKILAGVSCHRQNVGNIALNGVPVPIIVDSVRQGTKISEAINEWI